MGAKDKILNILTEGEVLGKVGGVLASVDPGAPPPGSGDMEKATYDPDENGVIAIAQGGTGSATAADARTALGILGAVYPVGCLYLSTVSTNPGTVFGFGTWAAFGAGRVIVGRDAGDADFDTAEETGGAKTVAAAGTNSAPTFTGSALGTHSHGPGTLAVPDHASHTHTYTDVPNHLHTQAAGTGSTGNFAQVTTAVDTSSGGTGATPTQTALGTRTGNPVGGVATGTTAGPSAALTHGAPAGSTEAVSAGTPAGTVAAPTFTGSPTSVVQPYIVAYIWKRTA